METNRIWFFCVCLGCCWNYHTSKRKKQNYLSFGVGCIPMRAYSLSIKLAQRYVAKSTVNVVHIAFMRAQKTINTNWMKQELCIDRAFNVDYLLPAKHHSFSVHICAYWMWYLSAQHGMNEKLAWRANCLFVFQFNQEFYSSAPK